MFQRDVVHAHAVVGTAGCEQKRARGSNGRVVVVGGRFSRGAEGQA